MYVGVTFTGNGPYRSEVPAVSSRSLDSNNLFQVINVLEAHVLKVTSKTNIFFNDLPIPHTLFTEIQGLCKIQVFRDENINL